ncbi:hypothetical protein LguiB_029457 [Lonicera macranthoides]
MQCRKIIGARYYKRSENFSDQEIVSPRDTNGHGTHIASTAAGGLVHPAYLEGFATGTTRGADNEKNYFTDSIAIGSFHAMQHGILTSTSAGNDGPTPSSISNFSPWSLSVVASTIDRKFVTSVLLGNNLMYQGVSIKHIQTEQSLVSSYIWWRRSQCGWRLQQLQVEGSLDRKLVEGKIVICNADSDRKAAISAGAVGIITRDGGKRDSSLVYPLPASYIGVRDGNHIEHYMNSTSNASTTILRSTELPDFIAPYVVSFSSTGPDPVNNELLKPDIAAPGVHILAAWPPGHPPSEVLGDLRDVGYNILSGTSMACPHATGDAVYVKSFHPKWHQQQ